MINTTVKISKYKCFGETLQGFEGIKPLNILIGRNNSGKSTLLELVYYATKPGEFKTKGHDKEANISITMSLEEDAIKTIFHPDRDGGFIKGNHWNFGKNLIAKEIKLSINSEHKKTISTNANIDIPIGFYDQLFMLTPFYGKEFRRLRAERDIQPEAEQAVSLNENGTGATTILQHFINDSSLPRDLVEKELLSELNKIFEPDSKFIDIVVQRDSNSMWEIYLEEEEKGLISLSKSGSGLKTILLVLMYILLLPKLPNSDKKELSNYIFAFEELENNLHPALQRRLFMYLRNIALDKQTIFFLTTHSSVVIDLFSNDANAQIHHIQHNGKEATSTPVTTYIEMSGILDDLDVRASDLLQSNGIIWVEGPSDRIYVNRWIEIWSKGQLHEGSHYQCVFYGGRLLAHLSASIPEEKEDLIKILLTNRNAIVLIDSDKKNKTGKINNTKSRMRDEIKKIDGFCWITKGKEVENYIPKSAMCSLYGQKVAKGVDLYEAFDSYLDNIKPGEGKKFLSNKVLFAEKIRPHLNKENLMTMHDFKNNMDKMIMRIKKWNSLQ